MDQHRDVLDHCFELVRAGRPAEAEEQADRAVRGGSEDGRLWQFLGLLRHRSGDLAGRGTTLETAGLLVPLEPPAQRAWPTVTQGRAIPGWPLTCTATSPATGVARPSCSPPSPPGWAV